jgi:hypothetical protein
LSGDADLFPWGQLFEYLANVTTFAVNAGLIAAAIWAWRHWGRLGELLKHIERLVRDAVEALRDYSRALREASQTSPRSQPEPPTQAQAATAAAPGAANESASQPPPPPPPPPQSAIKPELEPPQAPVIRRPGCSGYVTTVVVIVAIALLAKCMKPQTPVRPPATTQAPVAPTQKPPESVPLPPTTAAAEKNQIYTTLDGDSCWAIALRAADGDIIETRRIWLELADLNREQCSREGRAILRPGTQLQMPARIQHE